MIKGVVYSRSSIRNSGPPGERTILALNPQREATLKAMMQWTWVEPGTLNVKCDKMELEQSLGSLEPLWFEDASQVNYPEKYRYIPAKRQGYLYFRGFLIWQDRERLVLIRRAKFPLCRHVEVFSDIHLRTAFELKDKDVVGLEFVR